MTHYQTRVVTYLALVSPGNIEFADELVDVGVYGHGGYWFRELDQQQNSELKFWQRCAWLLCRRQERSMLILFEEGVGGLGLGWGGHSWNQGFGSYCGHLKVRRVWDT